MDEGEVETVNDCLVAGLTDGLFVIMSPKPRYTREQIVRLAAWIIALADPEEKEIRRVLDAVKRT